MIEMISGVYGGKNGMKRPGDGAFSLSPAEEARLVRRGVARYTNKIVVDAATTSTDDTADDELVEAIAPIGFDEIPADLLPDGVEKIELVDLSDLSAKQLREYGKENYGLTFKGNASKAEMLQAINEAAKAEYDEAVAAGIVYDGDAPDFDPAEAVV